MQQQQQWVSWIGEDKDLNDDQNVTLLVEQQQQQQHIYLGVMCVCLYASVREFQSGSKV